MLDIALENRSDIAGAVQYAYNLHSIWNWSIEN